MTKKKLRRMIRELEVQWSIQASRIDQLVLREAEIRRNEQRSEHVRSLRDLSCGAVWVRPRTPKTATGGIRAARGRELHSAHRSGDSRGGCGDRE